MVTQGQNCCDNTIQLWVIQGWADTCKLKVWVGSGLVGIECSGTLGSQSLVVVVTQGDGAHSVEDVGPCRYQNCPLFLLTWGTRSSKPGPKRGKHLYLFLDCSIGPLLGVVHVPTQVSGIKLSVQLAVQYGFAAGG